MKNEKLSVLILVFLGLIFGCKQKVESNKIELKKSEFKVAQNYCEFATKMENNDTLNIGVILSVCTWSEFDQLQITKSNDSVFLQLKEKHVMSDEPIHFDKVVYESKGDTLNLEKMMIDFGVYSQNKEGSPFFVIINPKEKDTILLKTTGLVNRSVNIDRYKAIMLKLYPEEMKPFRNVVPSPEVTQIEDVNM